MVDAQYRRYAGFGVVMAASEDAARAAMVEYLKNDHTHGKPYEVSAVDAHDSPEPYVAFFNWGDFAGGWPAAHDTAPS